jgi:hypothetical protein
MNELILKTGGMILKGETTVLAEKSVPVRLCSPKFL